MTFDLRPLNVTDVIMKSLGDSNTSQYSQALV